MIIFSSDNGGPTHGDELTDSSNFPLRGGKNTLWEGGNRVLGIVRGAGIEKTNYINNEKVHITDWLPTLVTMASGGQDWTKYIPNDEPAFQLGDGINLWPTISTGAPSPRDWILIETHQENETERFHGDALIVGDWKLLKFQQNINNQLENGWYPPPGQDPSTVPYRVKCADMNDLDNSYLKKQECELQWCLFNIAADPCEQYNLAKENPIVVQSMLQRLSEFQLTAVPEGVTGCDPVLVLQPNGEEAWQPCDIALFDVKMSK